MKLRGFQDFLVIAMASLATASMMFDLSKIGASAGPSDHHSSLVQLSALAMPSPLPAQPESLAGSKSKQGAALQPETNIRDGRASQSATKSKNVAPAKSGAAAKWVPVEISVYSARYHNGRTATGERYDHHAGFTAATTRRANGWDLPRGSIWEVNYRGKTVIVRVNDCGSYRPRKAKLWLDLSGAAWAKIAGSPSRYVAKMRRVK